MSPSSLTDSVAMARFRLFDSMLGFFPAGTAVDLGAGHGAFAIRAADAGWQVTAVDARTERFQTDPRITWVQQDVREVDLAPYDLLINLGLFYHLTLEDQLSLLDRSIGKPMILDTHVSTKHAAKEYPLSPMTTQGSYEGRLYSEAGLQHTPTASWGNLSSFWPTPTAQRRMLHERGWDVLTTTPYYLLTRTFFLCLPR